MWYVNDYALMESNVLSPNFSWFGDREKFFQIVCITGYPFFCWNGNVYKVKNGQIGYEDTGLTIENVRDTDDYNKAMEGKVNGYEIE